MTNKLNGLGEEVLFDVDMIAHFDQIHEKRLVSTVRRSVLLNTFDGT